VGDAIKFGGTAYYPKRSVEDGRGNPAIARHLPEKESSVGGSVVLEDESDGELITFDQSNQPTNQPPSGWINFFSKFQL
jgi:hypothetical protein